MRIADLAFGSIRIGDTRYDGDVVIDHGEVHRRRKKPSKRFRDRYGHTPLSLAEPIPWDCRRLVVGSGIDGALPVMDEVRLEAVRRGVELLILPTPDAVDVLLADGEDTNAVLHVTC